MFSCKVHVRPDGDAFRIIVDLNEPPPKEWADKADPLQWITAEYTQAIEQFVREDPTQYWWVHRRWKTRPREERTAIAIAMSGL